MKANIIKETIMLTPGIAEKFLSKIYYRQRKLNIAKAHSMARDLAAGRWNNDLYMVEPIMITSDGALMNGQHRCKMVLITGESIKVDVIYNAPEEWFDFIDCGTTRSLTQFINAKNANVVGALAKFAVSIENGQSLRSAISGRVEKNRYGTVSASRVELLAYIDDHKDDLEFCASKAVEMYKGCRGSKTGFANAIWLIRYLDSDVTAYDVDAFVKDFLSPIQNNEGFARGRDFGKDKVAESMKGASGIAAWCYYALAMWNVRSTKRRTFTQKYIDDVYKEYSRKVDKANLSSRRLNGTQLAISQIAAKEI